jgi:hypothetical protein
MKCTAKTKSGLLCQVQALGGSALCYFHAPQLLKERQAAQSRGGRAHTRSVDALPIDEFDLTQPAGIQQMLTAAANLLRTGRMDAKRVHALGHVGDTALKAYTLSTEKQQLERIEKLLEAHRNRPADPAAAEALLQFAPEGEFEIAAKQRLQDKLNAEPTPKNPLDTPGYEPTDAELDAALEAALEAERGK